MKKIILIIFILNIYESLLSYTTNIIYNPINDKILNIELILFPIDKNISNINNLISRIKSLKKDNVPSGLIKKMMIYDFKDFEDVRRFKMKKNKNIYEVNFKIEKGDYIYLYEIKDNNTEYIEIISNNNMYNDELPKLMIK